MTKVYSVVGFLKDNNMEMICRTCSECGFDVTFYPSFKDADGRVADGDIIYCSSPALLGQMPDLKWCQCANAGVDPFIATGKFDSGDTLLTNSSGSYGLAIAEHIIMVTLMLLRKMPAYNKILNQKGWVHNIPIRSIYGSKIAFIGTGDLGSQAAERFRALGAASVKGFSRSGRSVPAFDSTYKLSEIRSHLKDIDVLVMCVPGTPETKGLLNKDLIEYLPRSAYIVNVGRGTTVDQDALLDALNTGRIAGAALDVVYPEPLPEDHPLWTAENCIITPHISGDMGLPYTVEKTVSIFCNNLRRYAAGEPLSHLIEPRRGY